MPAAEMPLRGYIFCVLLAFLLWGCAPEADVRDLVRYCAEVASAPPPSPPPPLPAPVLSDLPLVQRSPFAAAPGLPLHRGAPGEVSPLAAAVAGSCAAEGERIIDRVAVAQLRVAAVVATEAAAYALMTLRSAAAPGYVVHPGEHVGCPAVRVRRIAMEGVLLEYPAGGGGVQLLEVRDDSS